LVIHILAPLCAQRHRDDVGACPCLGHRQRADVFAADELGQVTVALRVAAVEADLVDAQIRMRAVGEAHRPRGARDLLHRDHVGEVAEASAAPALGHGDTEQPLRAEQWPEVARELVAAVDLGGARRDALGSEPAHGFAQLLDFVGQVHGPPGCGRARSACGIGTGNNCPTIR
jgi:hypothetical protein